MQTKENKILILGMGNDILTDDGVGIKITKFLEKKYPLPNIIYDTLSLGGMEIIEYIRDFKMVIIIDAIKTQKISKKQLIFQIFTTFLF